MTVRIHLGGGNYADLEPELYEVDRLFLEPTADEKAARAAFSRWMEHGGARRWPDHPNLESVWPAFEQGWVDQIEGVSDFKRRGMAADERDAYMSGRFLSSAIRRRPLHGAS